MKSLRLHYVLLALIVLVAGWVRFHNLGVPAFRADTILLWTLAQRPVSVGDVWTKWFEVSGAAGQMPMPAVLMKAYLNWTGLPVTPFNTRFIFAVFGLLTLLPAYMAGKRLGGKGFALAFAALVALHPFAVQFSREAYFYATALFGYFSILWAAADIGPRLLAGEKLTWKSFLLLAVAVFFSAFSQITGLMISAALALYLAICAWIGRKQSNTKGSVWRLIAVGAVVLAPVVFSSWGLWPIIQQIGANKSYSASLVAQTNVASELARAAMQFSWGSGILRVALLLIAVAGFVIGVVRRDRATWMIVFIYVAQFLLFLVARSAAGAFYEARYLSGLFPFHLAALAYGLFVVPSKWLENRKAGKGEAPWQTAAACLMLAPLVQPAIWVTQLRGKPTPYRDIVSWCDAHLPAGDPVLVDRWFEPWNELRAHPGTNVIFTFTIPNEPVENYVQGRWRQTAMDFFRRFPQAGYLEVAKSFFDDPTIGYWNWPREYFAHHTAFTNEAGLKLRNVGLAARGDYFAANTNRTVVEFFWNEKPDIIARARAEGQIVLPLFGEGWRYQKSGPMQIFPIQTQQFMDWHMLGGQGVLELINLTDAPQTVSIELSGVSIGGPKQVRANNEQHNFQGGAMERWRISNIEVPGGGLNLEFRDVSGGRFPLLVQDLSVIKDASPRQN